MPERAESRGRGRPRQGLLSLFLSALLVLPNNPFVASAAAQIVDAAEGAPASGSAVGPGATIGGDRFVSAPTPLALTAQTLAAPLTAAVPTMAPAASPRSALAAPNAAPAPRPGISRAATPLDKPARKPASFVDAARPRFSGAPPSNRAPNTAPEPSPEEPSQDGRITFDGDKPHGASDLRPRLSMEAILGRRTSLQLPQSSKGKPIYVMASLEDVADWNLFDKQLRVLKANGISGVSTDLWWGKFQKSEKDFDWSYYLKYAAAVRRAGLRWEPILSFHKLGGNVGDTRNEPLPEWLGRYPDQETKFVDRNGFVNGEYLAPWFEGAYPHYSAAMASFAENFAPYADIISEINVSLGPAGELRYPSYNFAAGWRYPQRGLLQAYSAGAKEAFRRSLRRKYGDIGALNRAWSATMTSFDQVEPPGDDSVFQTETPFSRDFFSWYQNELERHLDRMMSIAHQQLGPKFPAARFGGKMAGIHWLYTSPTEPHAAEKAAGYVDYDRLISQFKKSDADLTFTALEMDDHETWSDPEHPERGVQLIYSAPQALVKKIAASAEALGVAISGENALPIVNDAGRYKNVKDALARGFGKFSLFRLGEIVDSQGNPTSEMASFVEDVVKPAAAERPHAPPISMEFRASAPSRMRLTASGRARLALTAWIAAAAVLIPLAVWAWPLLVVHYGAVAAAFGWIANITFLFFPTVQIYGNWRNMRAAKKGGAGAEDASAALAGVSRGANSQVALIGGNAFNFPSFLNSGSTVLVANALAGAGGSVAILGQLALSGHLSRPKWLMLAAGTAALMLLPVLFSFPAALAGAVGIAATAIFAAFTPPLIRQNHAYLAAIKNAAANPAAAQTALKELRGVKPLYLLVGMAGNLMLVPVFMMSGHWWNVVGNILGIAGPIYIMYQLAKAGLLKKKLVSGMTAGAVSFFLALTIASALASTGFWH